MTVNNNDCSGHTLGQKQQILVKDGAVHFPGTYTIRKTFTVRNMKNTDCKIHEKYLHPPEAYKLNQPSLGKHLRTKQENVNNITDEVARHYVNYGTDLWVGARQYHQPKFEEACQGGLAGC